LFFKVITCIPSGGNCQALGIMPMLVSGEW
jgi:hypothetical protein